MTDDVEETAGQVVHLLDEFAEEAAIKARIKAFLVDVMDANLTVIHSSKQGPVPGEPTGGQRIQAAKQLADLLVRKPGTKPPPSGGTTEDGPRYTPEQVLDMIIPRLQRMQEMQRIPEGVCEEVSEDDVRGHDD